MIPYWSHIQVWTVWRPIISDTMANTTGRNAAPNQDRTYNMFDWRPQALILPSVFNSFFNMLQNNLTKKIPVFYYFILYLLYKLIFIILMKTFAQFCMTNKCTLYVKHKMNQPFALPLYGTVHSLYQSISLRMVGWTKAPFNSQHGTYILVYLLI